MKLLKETSKPIEFNPQYITMQIKEKMKKMKQKNKIKKIQGINSERKTT